MRKTLFRSQRRRFPPAWSVGGSLSLLGLLPRGSEMTPCANKRHSFNREEGLEVAEIAPPEVGSDSGRH